MNATVEETDVNSLEGITPFEENSELLTAVMCRGVTSGIVPKKAATWNRYVKQARQIIDQASKDTNATGIDILGLAICNVLAGGYRGKHN